ncbi:MAG: hypothetical protein PHT19_04395 [Methylococcus sp.]|nr:hypothetical protein [Methylococcus sp.]
MKIGGMASRILAGLGAALFLSPVLADLGDGKGFFVSDEVVARDVVISACMDVTEQTPVQEFISKCAHYILSSSCRIYVETPCVAGREDAFGRGELEFLKEGLRDLGFEPVESKSVVASDFADKGAMYDSFYLSGSGQNRFCSPSSDDVVSSPPFLNPGNEYAPYTLHWTKRNGKIEAQILVSFRFNSHVGKIPANASSAHSASGADWLDIFTKFHNNLVKCHKDDSPPLSNEIKDYDADDKKDMLETQAQYIDKIPGALDKAKLVARLRQVMEYTDDQNHSPAATAKPLDRFIPKDPAGNYAGTPCEPFTQPVPEDGSAIYGNDSIVVYGKRAYRCEAQGDRKRWTLYGPREKLGKDWKNYEAARLEQ